MIDNHKVELDKTKEEYTKLKKAMDELRASEVCNLDPVKWWCHNSAVLFLSTTLCVWPKNRLTLSTDCKIQKGLPRSGK